MVKISKRGSMDSFIVMDTLAKANEMERNGETVYRFEAGQPAFKAPQKVRDAGIDAINNTNVGYTSPIGLPELRNEIANHYKDHYGADVNPNAIFITPGSSGAFSLTFLACFEAGDRVAMAMPCYPSYKRILESFGVEIVALMSTKDDKYQPTVALLEEAKKGGKIDGLIVASPNNPTGTLLNNEELTTLLNYCENEKIRVVSDELYHGVEFSESKPLSALQINNDSIIINSFSKFFCMTGWRLGWVIVPDSMIKTFNNLQSNLFISAPTTSQYAAVKAFECKDELSQNIKRYENNRDLFVKELTDMGITEFSYPEGGFYLYADISHLTNDSVAWANELLEKAKVSVSAGVDFDPYRGNTTIRFSYVCDYEHSKAGLAKLKEFINS
ncbi:MAG: pyridoxal phosphate-dependent aminotransferase [Alphaproteobacteria bacterium]